MKKHFQKLGLIVFLYLISGSYAYAQNYLWQEQQAVVTETGGVIWNPKPFSDNLQGQDVRYIDFESGDDANDGLSKTSAWKHHPWDYNATGNSKKSTGVKTYVFKRGVFYRGQLYARESGTKEHPIRLTSTAGWGEGEAVFAGSVKLSGDWVKAADGKFALPERLAEPENVYALELSALDWWNNGLPGFIAGVPDEYKVNRKAVSPPFVGLFSLEKDGVSKMNHLARNPNWQKDGDEFAHDYWPAFIGDSKPFEGLPNRGITKIGAQADELKGFPQDYFTGAIVWRTWPALMGGATPTEQLPEKVFSQETGDSILIYRPEDGSLAIRNDHGFSRGTRYMIENLPQYLDTVNEFYMYSERNKTILLYRPEEGKNPNDMHLELTVNEGSIFIENQSFIEISGLGFRYTDGASIELTGNCESVSVSHCVFQHLLKNAVRNSFNLEDYSGPDNPAEIELPWMNNILIADNQFYNIWDQSIVFGYPYYRSGRNSPNMIQKVGQLGNTEILRNRMEDLGIRHQGGPHSAIPAISVRGVETGIIAGNIIKRSLGSGIMVFGGQTSGLKDTEFPLTRILVYNNATEGTATGVNDYGGVSLWQGGVIYAYNNNIGNSLGHMPGGIFGSGRPRNLSYPYYIDGGFKILGFNNIIWGNSVAPDDPFRSMTAGYFSVFGFLNHFTNNTMYRQGEALGGSSGERTDVISNVFADISQHFLMNNRVENPSLVGGGDTGASGIQGIPSLGYGLNFFHGTAKAGTLISQKGSYGVKVHQEIMADNIDEMAHQMKAYPLRFADLGQYIEKLPIVGEIRPEALRKEGGTGADFRLREDSPAIDNGANYFVPWSLAGNVGEWHFTENFADPKMVVDYSFFMGEAHFNRFMYSWVPIYSLQFNQTAQDDYITAPSEDWVKGALSFDGSRYGTVKDSAMRKDIEMPITQFINSKDQRTWSLWERSRGKEQWLIPEPEGETDGEGRKQFTDGQIMKYPGERRRTLISKTDNLLLEVKFKTKPGQSSAYLISKHDNSNGYNLLVNKKGSAQFDISANGNQYSVSTSSKVNDGKWHHVLAEIDRKTGRMTIYLNGKKEAEINSGLASDVSIDNNSDFIVGKSSAENDGYLEGAIDFMRVCQGTLEDAKTTIGELYAWQYTHGPHLFDMRGEKPKGKRRDAGALELK